MRPTAPVLLTLVAVFAVVGCAPDGGQRSWVEDLERVDGVNSVDYEHIDHGLVGPSDDKATVELAAGLTEVQLEELVRASCARSAYLTEVNLVSPGENGAGSVTFDEAAPYGDGCLAIDTVRSFAAATAAMGQLRPAYDGGFALSGLTRVRERETLNVSEPTDAVTIVTTSTDKTMLLTALRTVRAHLGPFPVEYFGWFEDDDDPYTPSTSGIDARLSADADFDALDPLLAAAIDLGVTDIAVRDRTLDITLPSDVAEDAGLLAEQAAAAGITLTVNTAP